MKFPLVFFAFFIGHCHQKSSSPFDKSVNKAAVTKGTQPISTATQVTARPLDSVSPAVAALDTPPAVSTLSTETSQSNTPTSIPENPLLPSAPTLLSGPTGIGLTRTLPTQITLTSSAAIQPPPLSSISFTGTCTSLPSVSAIAPIPGTLSWVITLYGTDCKEGQNFTATVDPTLVMDASGTQAGTGAPFSQTYTLQTTGPIVTWNTPSTTTYLSETSSLSLPFTFTNATKMSDDTGESKVIISGSPTCTTKISNLSVTGGTLLLSHCSENGLLQVQLREGVVQDELGNPSGLSAPLSFIVDTTPPAIDTLVPATTPRVHAFPTTVTLTFTEVLQTPISNTLFSITSTNCQENDTPSISNLALSSSNTGSTIVTLTLTPGTCADGSVLTVTADPAQLVDLAGNNGKEGLISENYTLRTVGPITTLSVPQTTVLNRNTSLDIPVTYTSSGTITSTHAARSTFLSATATEGVSCTLTVSDPTNTAGVFTSILSLSHCNGTGTLSVSVNGGLLQDDVGNLSSSSSPLTLTVDTIPPVVTSVTPSPTQRINPFPSSITVVFSKLLQPFTSTPFSLNAIGCTTPPTISSMTLQNTSEASVATLQISPGVCVDGNIIKLTIDPTQLVDLAGNFATGTPISYSYTLRTLGPQTTLTPPASLKINATQNTVQIPVTYYSNSSTISVVATPPNPLYTILATDTATCQVTLSSPFGLGSSTATAQLSLSSCNGVGNFSIVLNAGIVQDSDLKNPSSSSNTLTFTVDTVAPTVISLSPPSKEVGAFSTIPLSVQVSELITLPMSPNLFTLSSTSCSILPTITQVTWNGTTATVGLSNGTCVDSATMTFTVDPTKLVDLAGNAGTGNPVSKTYTLRTVGPTTALTTPTSTLINMSTALQIPVTFSSTRPITLATLTPNPLFSLVGNGISCTLALGPLSGSTTTTATSILSLSGCTGSGTLALSLNKGIVQDNLGNLSSAPLPLNFSVDATAPEVAQITYSSIKNTPPMITVQFSEALLLPIPPSLFALILSNCLQPTSASSVTATSASNGATIATVVFPPFSCPSGYYYINLYVNYNTVNVTDLAGNTHIRNAQVYGQSITW